MKVSMIYEVWAPDCHRNSHQLIPLKENIAKVLDLVFCAEVAIGSEPLEKVTLKISQNLTHTCARVFSIEPL